MKEDLNKTIVKGLKKREQGVRDRALHNINQLQNKTISKRTHLSSILVSNATELLLVVF